MRLAAPELHLRAGQHDRLAAELTHRRCRTRRACGSRAGRRSSPASCRRTAARPAAIALDPRRLHRRGRRSSIAAKLAGGAARADRGNAAGRVWTDAFIRRDHRARLARSLPRAARGVEAADSFGDLLVGDDERRQHAARRCRRRESTSSSSQRRGGEVGGRDLQFQRRPSGPRREPPRSRAGWRPQLGETLAQQQAEFGDAFDEAGRENDVEHRRCRPPSPADCRRTSCHATPTVRPLRRVGGGEARATSESRRRSPWRTS